MIQFRVSLCVATGALRLIRRCRQYNATGGDVSKEGFHEGFERRDLACGLYRLGRLLRNFDVPTLDANRPGPLLDGAPSIIEKGQHTAKFDDLSNCRALEAGHALVIFLLWCLPGTGAAPAAGSQIAVAVVTRTDAAELRHAARRG